MHDFLLALQSNPVSTFVRESDSLLAFPTVLTIHAFAYCFILSSNAIVSGRILGFAKIIPVKPLRRLFPVMWGGLIVTAITGTLLVMASLADLRRLGYHRAVIPWTYATEYYRRTCGARIAHQFVILRKPAA